MPSYLEKGYKKFREINLRNTFCIVFIPIFLDELSFNLLYLLHDVDYFWVSAHPNIIVNFAFWLKIIPLLNLTQAGCAECLTASTCKTCKGGYYLSGTACLTCSTPNCHTCSGNVCSKCNQAASYSILSDRTCTQCQTTNGYYINVVSDINYCLSIIPINKLDSFFRFQHRLPPLTLLLHKFVFGKKKKINLKKYFLLACSTSNCKVCPSNTCTKCDQANNYYLYADNNCYTGCSTTNGYYVLNSGGVLKCLGRILPDCLWLSFGSLLTLVNLQFIFVFILIFLISHN